MTTDLAQEHMTRPKINCMTEAIYLKAHLITQLMRAARSLHNAVCSRNCDIELISTPWGMNQMAQLSAWLAMDGSQQYKYIFNNAEVTRLPKGVTHPGHCTNCSQGTDLLCPNLSCPMCCECTQCTCQFGDKTNNDQVAFLWCAYCDGPTLDILCALCGYCKQCCDNCWESWTDDEEKETTDDDSDSSFEQPQRMTPISHRAFAMRMNTTQSARDHRANCRSQRTSGKQKKADTRQIASASAQRYSPVSLRDIVAELV